MLEIIFWLLIAAIPAAAASYLYLKEKTAPAVALTVGAVLLLIIGMSVTSVQLVRGGQIGVALKGGNATTFQGFKINTLGTRTHVFDLSIPLDLNVERNGDGTVSERTVQLTPKDGSKVYLDARIVVALNSPCEPGKPKRCVTAEDRQQIENLAVQFRDGQAGIEKYITGKIRERANLVAASYDTADEMINQRRAEFIDAFTVDVSAELSKVGFDPTLFVVEQLVPSGDTQAKLDSIAAQRAETQLQAQQVETAKQIAEKQKTEADAAAYASRVAAEAEADGIRARGEAYSANPQAAAVDIAEAYGQQGNAVVITDGQAEVRPIITTGDNPTTATTGQ